MSNKANRLSVIKLSIFILYMHIIRIQYNTIVYMYENIASSTCVCTKVDI